MAGALVQYAAMRVDLHTHTSASDGTLDAPALLEQALAAGVELLSITDHDTTGGYARLAVPPGGALTLVPGVEFSTCWRKIGVHVVGLKIELGHPAVLEGVDYQCRARAERAERIAAALQKLGFGETLPEVQKIAGDGPIGRVHFARHLVATGVVRDLAAAFKKYLGDGKTGGARPPWAPLPQVVAWIRDAGGTAVLAHPAKYRLTNTRLLALIDDFRAAGGAGLEVVSGRQPPALTGFLGTVCAQKDMTASCGSDFHEPGQVWAALGQYTALPASCVPVWERW